jgi:glycosyltransferase involved in cell wall biosynthesis
MYLVVDAQALQASARPAREIERYARNLVGGLRAVAPDWRIELVQMAGRNPVQLDSGIAPVDVQTFHPPLAAGSANTEVNERYYADWLTARHPDAILVLDFFDGQAVVPRFTRPRPPLFGILYDLIPLLFAAQHLPEAEARRVYARRLRELLDADGVFAVSRAAAEAFRELLPGPTPLVVTIADAPDRWDEPARLVCEAMARAPVRHHPSGSPLRRVAWVSPMPPARSGIADYSAELLPHLARHFEVDVIIDPAQPRVAAAVAGRHRIVWADEVPERHRARPYDLFIYHLGNSTFHTYMLPLLPRFPGLVVLHDYHLGWLVTHAAVTGGWPTDLATLLEAEGEMALARVLRTGATSPWTIAETTALNGPLLALADAVVVHSTWAWTRVRRKARCPVAKIPPHVVMPALGTREAERARLQIPPDCFVVCTLGLVGPTKRIPSVLRGVAALPATIRLRTLLYVVGEVVDGSTEDLLAVARGLGIDGLVRFVGHVALHDLSAYGRAADACVQLRYPTHGEASASLVRALATATPCIVSDHGSIAEWPATIVIKVRTPEHEVEDLTRALVMLHEDPASARSLGESASRHVAAHHAIGHTAARYGALIDLVIAQRHTNDAAWCESASAALAASTDSQAATDLIDGWARLRAGATARPEPLEWSGRLKADMG